MNNTSNTRIDLTSVDIATLLPHAKPMILIDSMVALEHNFLVCSANSHLSSDNPLRIDGVLSIFSGIEYAAQAMAAHARLKSDSRGTQQQAKPARGFVAVASRLEAHARKLDDHQRPLLIRVEQVAASNDSSLYTFTIHAEQFLLLEGQLMAVIEKQSADADAFE